MIFDQEIEKIEKMYDTVAKEYSEKFSCEHEKKPLDREMLNRFAIEIGNRRPVWDLGCGPGQTTGYMNDLGIETAGLDISRKILEQARANHPGIEFIKGNILDLEFENESIAGIIAFYAIVHFSKQQTETALKEIFRVLRPSGLLLLTYHIGDRIISLKEFLGKKIRIDFMFFTTDFIYGCLEKCGFEKIDIIEREPYPDVEYPSRRAYAFAEKTV